MTCRELYFKIKEIFSDGERFATRPEEMFSLRELWLALCEKHSVSPECRIVTPDKVLPDALCEALADDCVRLCEGEPIQYYLGYTEFFGERFACREDVLIPRADTELLVSTAIEQAKEGDVILDLCSGSGAVGLSVLKRVPRSVLTAVDISDSAVSLTTENADLLGLSDRTEVVRLDVFSHEAEDLISRLSPNLILSNPPYIRTADMAYLPSNVKKEPTLALDGGADGLDFYRRIIGMSIAELERGARLIFEIGYDEGDALEEMAEEYSLHFELYRDGSGNDRTVLLYRDGEKSSLVK